MNTPKQPTKTSTMKKLTTQQIEVNRITDALTAKQAELAALDPVAHVAALEQVLDRAAALDDADAIAQAAAALNSGKMGTDELGTQRTIAQARIRALQVELKAAQETQRVAELVELTARKERLSAATVKAYAEYLALVDEVAEKYLRLSLTADAFNAVEARVRGVDQVNRVPVAPYVEITGPGGWIPCIAEADRKKRFGVELMLSAPPSYLSEAPGTRPWPQRELVERVRTEVEGI